MKRYFYLIVCHPVAGDKLTYAQQLGGKSSTKQITITYWAEHACRFATFKEACIFEKKVRLAYLTKNWAIEKYLMDVEPLSWAHPKGTPKEPPRYKNEIDFNEEYSKLTPDDRLEIDNYE